MKTIKIILIQLILCSGWSYAQKESFIKLEAGNPMPNFTLTNVHHYIKKQVNLADFKGKWLLLDVWSLYCSSCIASFPKYDKLQREFQNQLQVMLVGDLWPANVRAHNRIYKDAPGFKNATNKDELTATIARYELMRKNHDLIIPTAYDSIFYRRFANEGVPFILLLDPQGTIKAITDGLSKEDLLCFFSGKISGLNEYYYVQRIKDSTASSESPMITSGNGATSNKILYRSMITSHSKVFEWLPEMQPSEGTFELRSRRLNDLYLEAYVKDLKGNYGDIFPKIVFEVRDSSLFYNNSNLYKGIGLYSYSLTLPKELLNNSDSFKFESNTKAQKIMRKDLDNYFGYKSTVEIRKMPYLKLIADKSLINKLKTKGGETKVIANYPGNGVGAFKSDVGKTYINIPMNTLLTHLINQFNYYGNIILDETRFQENIDLKINAVSVDFAGVKKELARNGLHLVPAEKDMKVLVIKDADPESE